MNGTAIFGGKSAVHRRFAAQHRPDSKAFLAYQQACEGRQPSRARRDLRAVLAGRAVADEAIADASVSVLADASVMAAKSPRKCRLRAAFLESFQCVLTISLELLENIVFGFASHYILEYRCRRISKRPLHFHDCLFL
jgi:hypothetical protein